ncbi:MAG: adenylate/guanylate cyclase domain-containing protein [Sorangiineae bacterium PRO1]|nr:adenylate/guanylate cyclase domain-containing protein [Sorangiineae bacterium PRO1]
MTDAAAPLAARPTVLTPAARERRRMPRLALWVWLGAIAVSIPNPKSSGTIDGLCKLAAIIAACGLAAWLEERLFTRFVGRSAVWRVSVALLAPLLFLGCAPLFGVLLGLLSFVGDDGTTGLSATLACLWAASAATGTLVVVLIDVVVSALVQSLRGRIQLAVLSLVGVAAAGAAGLALVVGNTGEAIRFLSQRTNLALDLGEEGKFSGESLAQVMNKPEVVQLVSILLVTAFALMAFPAVLSACGKLADAVMERLHPLSQAFGYLGRGDLSVRVEEGGSRDFRALSQSFNQMVGELALSRSMERAFGQYVSGQVLGRIREQHGEATLPAELREASVFFADVRGFTSMSERLEPSQVLGVLNRYFERVVAVIDAHEGYLDKFIGDAVVVVFNGPIDQPDHAERAARCAIAVQEEVARLNAEGAFPEVGSLAVGVGVSTGPLVAGNLGSKQHMEYTVIGDTVNLAARLTGQAPAGEVWVNARNAELLPPELPRQVLAPFSVKGKTQPVTAYRVWPPPGASLPPPAAE